ncbi:MAG: 3-oxoacyl-ACP reductase FabG [Lentisphaeria bacterium]|nr:3-oxoacyl-ACP reductase FabG [Lentisphaeria bacterium]
MTQFDFSGQTAIVTGGTRGIGAAVSRAFLEAGATVVATYAGNAEAAESLARACGQPDRLHLRCFDVGDYGAVQAFYRWFEGAFPSLEVLVNNAGIRRDAVVGMMPAADWEAVLRTNLTGSFQMSKFAVLQMMQNRYGRIVNITSPSGKLGFEGQANYAASKAGQVALMRSLSKEVARRNITVNCVSPGFIETDLIGGLPEEQRQAYRAMVPLRRFGRASEVAACVLFLASHEASYVNGATVEVTGGL